MMNKTDAREELLRLRDEHERDRDGGYALVEAIRRARDGLEPGDRGFIAEALGDLVRGQDPQLWGVALEALVQLDEAEQVVSLGGEIDSSTRSGEWKDNVVLGLLRLEQRQFREHLLRHVRESLGSPRKLTIPIVAALCRVDREVCLELAVTFFDEAHAKTRNVEGFIPAFVRNFVAVDDALLAELVHRLSARRVEAGQWLADGFDAYLSKPWMIKELGSDRVARLRHDVRRQQSARPN
jgi:hypothetical protein